MHKLRIYTDGACSGNQSATNIGGWGCILEYNGHKKELYGGSINTTNNIMELTAMIQGLLALTRTVSDLEIFTDSAYIFSCFKEKWYTNWERNGWRSSNKTPVANQDLWQQLIPLVHRHHAKIYKIKGHVNLNSSQSILDKHFNTFIKHNGNNFSYDDFIYITKMNIRADQLANKGVAEIRN